VCRGDVSLLCGCGDVSLCVCRGVVQVVSVDVHEFVLSDGRKSRRRSQVCNTSQ